jgi:hypothetical protein
MRCDASDQKTTDPNERHAFTFPSSRNAGGVLKRGMPASDSTLCMNAAADMPGCAANAWTIPRTKLCCCARGSADNRMPRNASPSGTEMNPSTAMSCEAVASQCITSASRTAASVTCNAVSHCPSAASCRRRSGPVGNNGFMRSKGTVQGFRIEQVVRRAVREIDNILECRAKVQLITVLFDVAEMRRRQHGRDPQ